VIPVSAVPLNSTVTYYLKNTSAVLLRAKLVSFRGAEKQGLSSLMRGVGPMTVSPEAPFMIGVLYHQPFLAHHSIGSFPTLVLPAIPGYWKLTHFHGMSPFPKISHWGCKTLQHTAQHTPPSATNSRREGAKVRPPACLWSRVCWSAQEAETPREAC
jgi:hypothetical protein